VSAYLKGPLALWNQKSRWAPHLNSKDTPLRHTGGWDYNSSLEARELSI